MEFAPVYPLIYPLLKVSFPDCLWCGNPTPPAIALTFDDGPHPVYTPQLLKVLQDYQISATFFLLGSFVERYPDLVREIGAKGHCLAIHGYEHQSFPLLSVAQLQKSLEKTQQAIAMASGLSCEEICYVRPPNGLFTPKIIKLLKSWQYRPVMWSVVPEDWVRPGIAVVSKRVLAQLQNGSVIVLHDGYYGGQDVATIAAELIPLLLAQGYDFLTITQMWQTVFI